MTVKILSFLLNSSVPSMTEKANLQIERSKERSRQELLLIARGAVFILISSQILRSAFVYESSYTKRDLPVSDVAIASELEISVPLVQAPHGGQPECIQVRRVLGKKILSQKPTASVAVRRAIAELEQDQLIVQTYRGDWECAF